MNAHEDAHVNAIEPSKFDPLTTYTIRLGDDALIAGHRLSEWTGSAPMLEEELALANVALDLLGRARLCYGYAAERTGQGCTEDSFAFQRDCRAFTNHLIHELPRGDFAFTMARQFLVDCLAVPFLDGLVQTKDPRLAGIGAKCAKESRYHLRRSTDWMVRLGDGTDESHRRLQSAVDELWGFTPELFAQDGLEAKLVADGFAVDLGPLHEPWLAAVNKTLAGVGIVLPTLDWQVDGGRQGLHTEHLGHLLSELQFVQRAYPGQQW